MRPIEGVHYEILRLKIGGLLRDRKGKCIGIVSDIAEDKATIMEIKADFTDAEIFQIKNQVIREFKERRRKERAHRFALSHAG